MQRKKPTKIAILAELQRISHAARDGRVSRKAFQEETGWGEHWFYKFWPVGGYRSACEEAGVAPGEQIGVETNLRVDDSELATRFAKAVKLAGKVPNLMQLVALTKTAWATYCRGDSYRDAKKRIIFEYFQLPLEKRLSEPVEGILRKELIKLGDRNSDTATPASTAPVPSRYAVDVRAEFIALVREFLDRGEEEKRQLVAQFFFDVLGYKRSRVSSEHERIDVRVDDRRGKPWLVVEVKSSLGTERAKRSARRQAFDYAHRKAIRFVVISDGDFYEVFDRCAGQQLSYNEMRQGCFQLTALRSRDGDLLGLLASER